MADQAADHHNGASSHGCGDLSTGAGVSSSVDRDPSAESAGPGGSSDRDVIPAGREALSFPAAEGWVEATGGERFEVRFRPLDARIPRNEEFSLEVAVLDRGAPARDATLVVWGDMPAHGHGLVRQPIVEDRGDGRFGVDAMLLHMRGHWEMTFEVVVDGASEVLVHELDL